MKGSFCTKSYFQFQKYKGMLPSWVLLLDLGITNPIRDANSYAKLSKNYNNKFVLGGKVKIRVNFYKSATID